MKSGQISRDLTSNLLEKNKTNEDDGLENMTKYIYTAFSKYLSKHSKSIKSLHAQKSFSPVSLNVYN